MNEAHVKAVLEGVIPAVKAAIAAAQKPLHERIELLEKRAPEKGEKGDPGQDGSPGENGKDGRDGEPGRAGDLALAPDELAKDVAAVVRLLAEAPPLEELAKAVTQPPVLSLDLKGSHAKRTVRFERDPKTNRIIAAHEEASA